MSDPFFYHSRLGDKTDRPLFPFAGVESKHGYHALERPSYLRVYQASRGANAVSHELRRNVFPPKDWLADTMSIQTRGFNSSPFPPLPTLRGSPIPSHASDNSPPHFGYNANPGAHHLTSEHHPQVVAMPTLAGRVQHGGLIDAHACHYDPSFGFVDDNYMVDCPRALPSPIIAMPIVPTYLDVGTSNYVDPILPSDPTLRWSPSFPITAYQNVSPPDSTPSLSASENFDSESFFPPSPPLSSDGHSLVSPEMLDQIHPQPTSIDQLHTFTVPLQSVEFPLTPNAGDVPFFLCCWEDCGMWITSDKDAVKNHLACAHGVLLKGKWESIDSARCHWVGCSSSLQRCGLVRHFLTHLGLKWLCSVCKGAYTRADSVGYHARREPRCESAQPISHPSLMAYRARINEDNTVTLTKVVQP